jgi:hypothetical protein
LKKLSVPQLLDASEKATDEFWKKMKPVLVLYRGQLEALLDTLNTIEESHSGSWAGYHAELYYGDFQKPPLNARFDVGWGGVRTIAIGWQQRTYDEIAQFVKSRHKRTDLDRIVDRLVTVRDRAGDLRSEVLANLSFIRGLDGFDKEIQALESIEKLQLTISAQKWVDNVMPKTMITRDTMAVAQGIKIPPHIRYRATVTELLSIAISVEKLVDQSKTLIRTVLVRLSIGTENVGATVSAENVVFVCEHFHEVARQLAQRFDHRETLVIRDEHDAQDLLHALLRMFFDDVRPEEHTPSHAGAASRVDFLVKAAHTAVEVKCDLSDKQVGDQLLVDIQRYSHHPDCRTLLCFVYDPNGRIKNPRGLEKDLSEQSTDKLEVIVMVRPQS